MGLPVIPGRCCTKSGDQSLTFQQDLAGISSQLCMSQSYYELELASFHDTIKKKFRFMSYRWLISVPILVEMRGGIKLWRIGRTSNTLSVWYMTSSEFPNTLRLRAILPRIMFRTMKWSVTLSLSFSLVYTYKTKLWNVLVCAVINLSMTCGAMSCLQKWQ